MCGAPPEVSPGGSAAPTLERTSVAVLACVAVSVERRHVRRECFNPDIELPYELRRLDFESAMQDVYDFFYDVNQHLAGKGLGRLEDTVRSAILSGVVSDMLTAYLASHSRTLVTNGYHNGHPDLVVAGTYPEDAVKAGEAGVEVKATTKRGGAVDTHGARDQWFCVFVYLCGLPRCTWRMSIRLTFAATSGANSGLGQPRSTATESPSYARVGFTWMPNPNWTRGLRLAVHSRVTALWR